VKVLAARLGTKGWGWSSWGVIPKFSPGGSFFGELVISKISSRARPFCLLSLTFPNGTIGTYRYVCHLKRFYFIVI
jgi:hypothetical protein